MRAQLAATDGNAGDTLTFSASGLPAGLSITSGGLISGTPSAAGTASVTATVSDGRGGSDSETFSWVIQPPPDTTPPSVPGSLGVTGTTATSISLSWNGSTDTGGSGLAGYRIYRDGASTALAAVIGTTFTDTGLASGTTHTYRVTAYDIAGNESAAAGPVSGTARDTQPPTTPTSLQASNVTATSARLTWQPSTDTGGSGLAGYWVFRDGTLIATVTGTVYTAESLSPGSRYRFAVAAYDDAGNQSALSGQATVNTRKR